MVEQRGERRLREGGGEGGARGRGVLIDLVGEDGGGRGQGHGTREGEGSVWGSGCGGDGGVVSGSVGETRQSAGSVFVGHSYF